jgi:hypothetical protein
MSLIDNKLYFNDEENYGDSHWGAVAVIDLETEEFSNIELVNPELENILMDYPGIYPSRFIKLNGMIYFKGSSERYGREFFRFTP